MRSRPVRSTGYTLVEVLIATTLALMLMAAVAQMFAQLGTSVNYSRATLETADRLRAAALRLQMDLDGLTVTMLPPRRVENEEGYFEYIEGGIPGTPFASPWTGSCPAPVAINSLTSSSNDSTFPTTSSGGTVGTVGEVSDILMFTTRNSNRPFTGIWGGNTIQSETAEVAWFMRGHNLYRRVLLVAPGLNSGGVLSNAASSDISVHAQGSSFVANTLGDLTRRECRFGHSSSAFPYLCSWGANGLPTLADNLAPCTPPNTSPLTGTPTGSQFDYWTVPPPPAGAAPRTDDLILTNVIGFDVKAWDPGAQAYVDLASTGTVASPAAVTFAAGNVSPISKNCGAINAAGGLPFYDTGSTSYESTGIGNPANAGQGTNGFDANNTGVVDSPADALTAPPFMTPTSATSYTPTPLRGIQIKVRVFEPDSRSVREVTVTQDFLPK